MGQPVGGDLHVNVPLTNVSVAYLQSLDQFIADKVFPGIPVESKSGLYWKYDKPDFMRTVAKERAPGTESAGSGWTVSQGQYSAKVFAVHKDVSDQDRAIADKPIFDLDRDSTQFVMRDLTLQKELAWAAKYMAGSIWTPADQTGEAASPSTNQFLQWNQSASTPIQDIRARATLMASLTGFKPNTMVFGPQVFDALVDHPEFTDRIKYTQTGIVTADLIGRVLDIPKILVPLPVVENAVEGGTTNIGFVYGKSSLLVYAAPSASVMMPSAGYTFNWTGYLGAAQNGQRMKKFRMEPIASDRIEGEMAYDFELVSADLGQFFASCVA